LGRKISLLGKSRAIGLEASIGEGQRFGKRLEKITDRALNGVHKEKIEREV